MKMNGGWDRKQLGELLQKTETINPLTRPGREFKYIDVSSVSNETFQIESTQCLLGRNAPSRARRLVRSNDVLFATVRPTLRRIAMVPIELNGHVCSTGFFVLRPKPELDHRYLFYSLFSDPFLHAMENLQRGTSYPAVTDSDVRAQQISFPSPAEQRRIVGILDEAFASIATAKANTEKNLQNARALFESHLHNVFVDCGDGWIDTTIGDQIQLQRGFDITKKEQRRGDVPVVSSGGIKSFHDCAMANGPGVVMGRKGTLGKVFYISSDYWPHDTTLWVKDFNGNHPRFVYYFLKNLDVVNLDTGTANPALNRNLLHPIRIGWPPFSKQTLLAETFDSLETESSRLESIYRKKLDALDELKMSLLHQAFSGQL